MQGRHPRARSHPPAARVAGGFTLVEVMVALLVMAVIAALAWRGIDGVVRSRDASRESVERTVRLNTVLTQWEQDLAALHDTGVVPALGFDGRAVRLTRSGADGVRVVVWFVQDGTWIRWAAPAITRVGELREAWLRSQQLTGDEPGSVRLIDGIETWTVFCFRGNGWSNCQSTGDLVQAPMAPASSASAPAAPAAGQREALPDAVRLQVSPGGQAVLRDIALGPQSP